MSDKVEGEDLFTPEEKAAWDSQFSDPASNAPASAAEAKPEADKPVAEPVKPAAAAITAKPDVDAAAAPAKPEAQPQPDEDGEEAFEGQIGENKGRFVRHGAFHKEREQRKALQKAVAERDAELTKLREQWGRADERLKLLSEAMQPKQSGAEEDIGPPPDPEQDIFGFVKWQGQKIARMEQQLSETRGATQEIRSDTEMRSAYQADASRFASQRPDFGRAYQHALVVRDRMLQAAGIADPMRRQQIIVDEERGLVQSALAENQSPAARMYELAVALGYTPAAAAGGKGEQKPADQPEQKPNGAAPATATAATAPAAPAKPTAAEEIARIQAAQTATRSLSNSGGTPSTGITVEQLANMSEDEFAKLQRRNPALINQLMGAAA